MKWNFNECLAFVLSQEGGFVSNKLDPGGATNKGVTQAVYDSFRRKRNLPTRTVKDIEYGEVDTIYRGYWEACHADEVPPPLTLALFDTAINFGTTGAIKLLQEAIGAVPDGIYGPATNEKVLAFGAVAVAKMLCKARVEFRADRVQKRPDQVVFLKGWLRRDLKLLNACNDFGSR